MSSRFTPGSEVIGATHAPLGPTCGTPTPWLPESICRVASERPGGRAVARTGIAIGGGWSPRAVGSSLAALRVVVAFARLNGKTSLRVASSSSSARSNVGLGGGGAASCGGSASSFGELPTERPLSAGKSSATRSARRAAEKVGETE
ncbi:MAG: hypothetical protein U0353_20870 [Sandaracinus sp.]